MSCPISHRNKLKNRKMFEVCLKWQSRSVAKGRQGRSFLVPQWDAVSLT